MVTDRRTDVTKLIVAFPNFANAMRPKTTNIISPRRDMTSEDWNRI